MAKSTTEGKTWCEEWAEKNLKKKDSETDKPKTDKLKKVSDVGEEAAERGSKTDKA